MSAVINVFLNLLILSVTHPCARATHTVQLKLAQQAREGVDKQYRSLATSIKDLEEHIRQMLSRKEVEVEIQEEEEETGELEGEIKWLSPKPKTRVQAALDTAKALSERVYGALQYVAGAAVYLPHQLKGGATNAYEKAHELYTTLKPVSCLTRFIAFDPGGDNTPTL